MKKIIYIADSEIIAIPIIECHEEMIDLKNQHILQYGPPPETPLTAPHYTKLRKSVYERLYRAQKDLPDGWRFRIYEGFRSLEVQKMLFDDEYQKIAKQSANQSQAEIFHQTTRLVSPIINVDGTNNIPPHNTGAAVDIEIVDKKGKLIDMGMEAKDWTQVDPDLCLTDCKTLSAPIKKNRQLLLDIMTKNDFINYPTEWWHFSYGDRYWAYHKKQSYAIYGPADNIQVNRPTYMAEIHGL